MRLNRRMAVAGGGRGEQILGVLALGLSIAAAVIALAVAPADAEQGDVQRLMYVHVPSAWLAYLAFFVVFIGSVQYLRTRRTRWDRLAHASAEIGVLFTALAIALGSLWGKPVWGVWWTWDPRLTTTAILLLIYVGYLSVRRISDSPAQRAKWSAVVGVIGFVDVPVVHLSVTWWRSLHQPPSVLRPGAPTLAPSMLFTLLFAVAAFTVLYAYLLVLRLHVERLAARAEGQAVGLRLTPRPTTIRPSAPAIETEMRGG
ncbi:MAG TPA: cytochrome c biogenesis protein CcsA [Actinomycetota bacterium]